MSKYDFITTILATPLVLALGILVGIITGVVMLFYVPIKFLLILWGKENDLQKVQETN